MTSPESKPILIADDSPEDRFLLLEACRQAGIRNRVITVEDGEQAISYLAGDGVYSDRVSWPVPALVILDIKMPRKSGLDVLAWLRGQDRWKTRPVIMLTASAHPDDIDQAYRLGANSFIMKPSSVQELVEIASAIKTYWMCLSILPE